MEVKDLHAESLRFPALRKSEQGESAPKARPQGVVDGKLVKIPVLAITAKWGRRRLRGPGDGYPGLSVYGVDLGKSGSTLS